jgi:hypothetical protein
MPHTPPDNRSGDTDFAKQLIGLPVAFAGFAWLAFKGWWNDRKDRRRRG